VFSRQRPTDTGSKAPPPRERGAMPAKLLRAVARPYFEYSSTMSCSCTGAATSRRSGLRSTFAVSDS
jgi:hypothetical protein